MEPTIYGIRFSKVGKIYHFDASVAGVLNIGEHVVVETTRGRQLGEIIVKVEKPGDPPEGGWKAVERKATPADLVLRQQWIQKQTAAMIECRARAAELQLEGIKIISAEYSFDGSRLTFMFSSENEEKPELKSLRKDMQRMFPDSQVEMRQIGPRDVAKLLGGMGACGLETRCCSKFLTDFSPISIKMAKEQGISLTPTEITGMCGRLRCCLIYEYEQYVAARKELPKRNKRVVTPDGEGKVVDVYPLRNVVIVELDPKPSDRPQDRPERPVWKEFHRDVLEPWDELEALRRKSEAPCDRHEGGECDCGKDKAELKEPKETKDTKETKDVQDNRNNRDRRDNRDNRDNRDKKHR
jgi:cell fate regulator YaaT (PSP1 superfamily)